MLLKIKIIMACKTSINYSILQTWKYDIFGCEGIYKMYKGPEYDLKTGSLLYNKQPESRKLHFNCN